MPTFLHSLLQGILAARANIMIHIGGNKMPSEGNEQRACSALMCFWFACICISLLAVVVVVAGCCCSLVVVVVVGCYENRFSRHQ